MAKIEITIPGERIVEEFTALVPRPTAPSSAPPPPIGLVEISHSQPTELIPGPVGPQGPRGSRWTTGAGDPTVPGGVIGDMYLDDTSGAVWAWDGTAWVNTGTNIQGSPDTGPQILAKLAPVDGAGSGLDADTLDGMDSTAFATDAELAAAVASMTTADNLRVLKAGDTMTGALKLPHGTVAAPAVAIGEANHGFYGNGSSGTGFIMGLSVNGGLTMRFAPAANISDVQLRSTGGTASAPGFAFSAENNTGWYWAAANNVRQVMQGNITLQYTSTALTAFVPLNLPAANPTVGTHATHKTYVDAQVATKLGEAPQDGLTYGRKNAAWATIVGGAVISDTPPPGPLTPGQLWWESDTGNTYLWFDDGDTQQWVQQNIQPAAVPGDPPVAEIRGDWTPSLTLGGVTTGQVYTQRVGRFVKQGSKVTYWFDIGFSNKGSGAGQVRIEGQPYPCRAGTPAAPVTFAVTQGMAAGQGTVGGQMATSNALLNYFASTGTANLTEASITNTTRLIGSITIETT